MKNKIIFKHILLFLLTFTMILNSYSQEVRRGETRILVNKAGDTMLIVNLADAKIILAEVLDKPYADSILAIYKRKDVDNAQTIFLYKSQLNILQQKSVNQEAQMTALNDIIDNKDKEIIIKDGIIKKQAKEIKKQVRIKKIAISAAIILPLAVIMHRF